MPLADSLALQEEAARLAYLRHAARPSVLGPAGEHLRLWASLYEARACLSEQNPAFAATLLPMGGFVPLAAPGLPVLPAGVRWAVDEDKPGTISLAVDVASPVTLSVLAPGATTAFTPTVVGLPTRASTTFPAKAEGLYQVVISLGATHLATIYVPVMRELFRRFRELSRALAFGFTSRRPRPTDNYQALLSCIITATAAAQTGQVALYAQLVTDALALEQAPSPVALYPHG